MAPSSGTAKKGLLSAPIFDSRIKSANTSGAEKVLGYFVGPAIVFLAYHCIASSYLTQFYTDVLGLTGAFITFMPLISRSWMPSPTSSWAASSTAPDPVRARPAPGS